MSYRKQIGALLKSMGMFTIITHMATQPSFSMNEELLPSTSAEVEVAVNKLQYQEFSRTHSSTDLDLEENKESLRGSFVTVNDDSLPINNQKQILGNPTSLAFANTEGDPYIFPSPLKFFLSDYYHFNSVACLLAPRELFCCNKSEIACFGYTSQLIAVLVLTTYSNHSQSITALSGCVQTFCTLSELRNRMRSLTCNTICEDPSYYMMTTLMFTAGVGGTIASWVYHETKDQDAYGTAFCCAFGRLILFAGWIISYCTCQSAS